MVSTDKRGAYLNKSFDLARASRLGLKFAHLLRLCADPHQSAHPLDVGFQLSFVATLDLILLVSPLSERYLACFNAY
jgi:hypothetical protein